MITQRGSQTHYNQTHYDDNEFDHVVKKSQRVL